MAFHTKRMVEGQTTVVVMTNLLWSLVLHLGYMLQQCYMPYGYMFSNRNNHVLRASVVYKRKTTSIFEILDFVDDVEVALFVMYEYGAAGEDSIEC